MQNKTIKTKSTIGDNRVKLKIFPRFRQDQIFAHFGGSMYKKERNTKTNDMQNITIQTNSNVGEEQETLIKIR